MNFYSFRQYQDQQIQEVRQWVWQTQEGLPSADDLVKLTETARSSIVADSQAYEDFKQVVEPLDTKPVMQMTRRVLDNAYLQVTMQSPSQGPLWLSADFELQMYYAQQNSAAFEWGDAWELSFEPTKVLADIGEWSIASVEHSPYHVRLLARVAARVVKRFSDFKFGLQFRCGTQTAKGQWLSTSVRCELAVGVLSLGLPTVGVGDPASSSEEEDALVCAGEADEFILVDLFGSTDT